MQLRLAIALLAMGVAAPAAAQLGARATPLAGEAAVVGFGQKLPPQFELVSKGVWRSSAPEGCFARYRDPDSGNLFDRPTCMGNCAPTPTGAFRFASCTIF